MSGDHHGQFHPLYHKRSWLLEEDKPAGGQKVGIMRSSVAGTWQGLPEQVAVHACGPQVLQVSAAGCHGQHQGRGLRALAPTSLGLHLQEFQSVPLVYQMSLGEGWQPVRTPPSQVLMECLCAAGMMWALAGTSDMH
jgi:hypothetical protein